MLPKTRKEIVQVRIGLVIPSTSTQMYAFRINPLPPPDTYVLY